jgi:hypothetical protein
MKRVSNADEIRSFWVSRIRKALLNAPPMVGSTYAYLSLFGLGVGPSRLFGRLGGEPSRHDIT